MKQFILLTAIILLGSMGSLFHPFWGLLMYYTLSVLRPQTIWNWALPQDWPWSRIAAGAVLVGLFVNFSHIWTRARLNAVAWMLIAFGSLQVFSVLTAYDPVTAQYWGIEYGKVLIIALIVAVVIRHFWQVKAMAAMILVCLGYIAWEVNARYLFDGRLDIFHYGYGEYDNNGAGLMLAMGVPIAYAFAVTARQLWTKAFCAGIGILMLHAVMMSYSRGAMLAALVSILWVLWHHRPRLQAVGIALILCLIVPVLAGPQIRDRFLSTANFDTDSSAVSRITSWSAAWEITKEHPLTGLGIRNSNMLTKNYGADQVGRTIHSQYFQIAADSGLPAMLVYLSMMGTALWYFGRSRRHLRDVAEHDLRPRRRDRLLAMEKLLLGCQASLLVFAFGGAFLSLEVFELPWLMISLAGLMPALVRDEIGDSAAAEYDLDPDDEPRGAPLKLTRDDEEDEDDEDAPRPAGLRKPRAAGVGL